MEADEGEAAPMPSALGPLRLMSAAEDGGATAAGRTGRAARACSLWWQTCRGTQHLSQKGRSPPATFEPF